MFVSDFDKRAPLEVAAKKSLSPKEKIYTHYLFCLAVLKLPVKESLEYKGEINTLNKVSKIALRQILHLDKFLSVLTF